VSPPAPSAWTDLGNGVRVRQSVAFAMNSTLLLHPDHALVVDPGVLPSELDDLASAVQASGAAEVTLFLTHAHWDHVLGRPWWPGARVIAHDRFAAGVRAHREDILARAREGLQTLGETWERGFEPFRPHSEVSGLHFMKLDPWPLVFRDAPGHHDTQLSLHLPDRRILIAADMLSDRELPILSRPCAVYRRTLEELLPLANNGAIETLIPGHGAIARGQEEVLARLDRDLAYLYALETEVRAAVREGLPIEQAKQRLGSMEHALGHSPQPTLDDHLANVEVEYQAAVTAEAPRARKR